MSIWSAAKPFHATVYYNYFYFCVRLLGPELIRLAYFFVRATLCRPIARQMRSKGDCRFVNRCDVTILTH